MKIVFATNNEHKLREVRQILDGKYEVLSLADIGCHADIPETADTLDGNALQKARYVYERYGIDVFADDTGLEVEALDGAPGVHTARYAGEAHDTKANVDLLLHNMQGKDNRHACFRTAIALIQGGEEHLFEGRVDGEITETRIGETGFGYDPVFRPDGYDGTFAELGESVKNGISHRARAVAQLVKYLGLLLLVLLPAGVFAQVVGEWTMHSSYGDAQQVVNADGTLWCVSSGNLWMLDTESEEIVTFDHTRGLNDKTIQHIAYDEFTQTLIVTYENSNIDLIDTRTLEIHNIAAIASSTQTKKDINHILTYNGQAWLSTAFGIVVIDLDQQLVHATYNYTSGVNALAIGTPNDVPTLYIATSNGISYRPLSDNQYNTTSLPRISATVVTNLVWWNDALLAITKDGNNVVKIGTNGSMTQIPSSNGTTVLLPWGENMLTLSPASIKLFYPTLSAIQLYGVNSIQGMATVDDSTLALAFGYRGLVLGRMEDRTLTLADNGYRPAGPRLNNINRLRYTDDGTLLAVQGGEDSYDKTWFPSSLDIMRNGIWENFDTVTIHRSRPYHNMTDMVQDPSNPNHHFATSYGSGLLEYTDGHLTNRFTGSNSPLVSLASNTDLYTRLGALEYDQQGNLWVSMSSGDSTLVCYTPSQQWKRYYAEGLAGTVTPTRILSQGNYLWVVSKHHPDLSKIGILCIDTKGTPTNFADDRTRWVNNPIVQQDGLSYNTQHIYDLAVDHEGQLWVGTDMGLFVITSAEDFMQRNFTYHQIKVNRNDGSGLADYLLSGIWIMAIEVDAADRKWIGTDGQGVYLVSADGQEELEHFTTDNSPLPSDHITSLAYDDLTGTLAIGTQKGIITYNTNSLMAAETLDEDNVIAYPNPVPPDYHRPVTIKGMTNDCEVKIASVTGRVVYVTRSNGGMAQWNLCNSRGQRVATGVYYVICTDTDGTESIVTRIVVTN